jgi:hypothetical protein
MLQLTYNAASACVQCSTVESRPTEATQICGVQYSIPNRFLTGTPKQLEIAVTRTKQNTEVISNRDTNTTPPNAIRPSIAGLVGAPSASRSGRDRRAEPSHHRLSHGAPIPNQQIPSLSLPYRARHTPFLIVSPKRLKIAVTFRKQNTEVISNRIKIGHSRNALVACESQKRRPFEAQGKQDAGATIAMVPKRVEEPGRVLLDFNGRVEYAARTLGDREGCRTSAPSLVQTIGRSNQERSLGGRSL